VAVGQAAKEVLRMADVVMEMLQASLPVFLKGDKEGRHAIVAKDDRVDALEQATSSYLAALTREEPDEEPARRAIALLYIVNELEHIGDVVSKNLMSYAKKKIDENLSFSAEGLQEITEFHQDIVETLRMASSALSTWDYHLARQTAARKEFGNQRLAELHSRHLDRLRQGLKESIDTSTIHLDFIADLERMNFHAAAIGAALAGSLKGRQLHAPRERR
jgi:phosphate:Na+ symporter